MRLGELIRDLPIELRKGSPDTVIEAVVEDSRAAGPGTLFVARPGAVTDGRRFVADAAARGATAVLSDRRPDPAAGIVELLCEDVPGCAARVVERFHGEPSHRLALVGVTGTNGKTTVASLARQLLDHGDVPCGLIGTVGVDSGGHVSSSLLTTPSAFQTSELLAAMVDGGCRACVMEASSHALDQGRTAGLRFAGAVFTNLSGDHLDYHGDMDAYADAKAQLFASLPEDGWAVLNADDAAGARMTARCAADVITTSLTDAAATCVAEVGALSTAGMALRLRGPWGAIDVDLPLVGRHNAANALQAAAVAWRLGVDTEALTAGLARVVAPPGRLEPVTTPDDDVTVLVDYAHTDDALANVLAAVRPLVPDGGRLFVVFGCGGDRDRAKRPRMAAVACRGADRVFVTSDNPRTEEPERIVDEIMTGVPRSREGATTRVTDRGAAIRASVDAARPGDVVLIAGKGHEDYQIVGTTRHPFDDRLVARETLAARRAAAPRKAEPR